MWDRRELPLTWSLFAVLFPEHEYYLPFCTHLRPPPSFPRGVLEIPGTLIPYSQTSGSPIPDSHWLRLILAQGADDSFHIIVILGSIRLRVTKTSLDLPSQLIAWPADIKTSVPRNFQERI